MQGHDHIDEITNTFNKALTDLFAPVVDSAKTAGEANALRTILVAVLANKLAALIRGAPDNGMKGDRRRLRALVDDVLNEKLN
jgi:hypothetical protein